MMEGIQNAFSETDVLKAQIRVLEEQVAMLRLRHYPLPDRRPVILPGRPFHLTLHHYSGGLTQWRIGAGFSSSLLAQGSAWSLPFGRALMHALHNPGEPAPAVRLSGHYPALRVTVTRETGR